MCSYLHRAFLYPVPNKWFLLVLVRSILPSGMLSITLSPPVDLAYRMILGALTSDKSCESSLGLAISTDQTELYCIGV